MDEWRSELMYIHSVWNNSNISGRPLVVLVGNMSCALSHLSLSQVISENMMRGGETMHRRHSSANVTVATLKKLKTGYLGGARVVLKKIVDFFRTTTVSKLELRACSQFL